ncbi:MAG: peptide-N-glycosidase F-related protein [Myxococcota bacterium]|nr:peptide-N-glycosidase F-related protein [Myxococcota bacterium]
MRNRLLLSGLPLILLLTACPGSDDDDDTPPPEPSFCEANGWQERAWNGDGPYGELRHDLADDFSVDLLDGTEWNLRDHWTGCENYVFLTDRRYYSQLNTATIWEDGVADLISRSPRNVHYFFISDRSEASTDEVMEEMADRVAQDLASLGDEDYAWWSERIHLVADHVSEVNGWVEAVLEDVGYFYNFGIDREQRIRLLGSFADVNRYDAALSAADAWPWESNLAYAGYEPRSWNFLGDRAARLEAEDVTVVTAWEGEVLAHVVETVVDFPDAATLAGFDTLEIDLVMDCADPEAAEFGNCGSWDYLSHIYLVDEAAETSWELARFITTYHREGHYVVDATPMLVHLAAGGPRTIEFHVSPSWNPQAYLTRMDFRFSNRGKGHAPSEATYLWGTRSFDSSYNEAREPVEVAIPAGAQKVELWALITGHGMDNGNCAEFCNHQHEFTVGTSSYTESHDTVGDNMGCVSETDNGMVPNQGGTWWFGRGGWCPGQQVEPTVFDVTEDVEPGSTATVSYRALLSGSDSIPDGSGNIVLSSYLVVYE